MMDRIRRAWKAVVAGLGFAAVIAVTIPHDSPLWRTAQAVLAVAGILGVYKATNAPPAVPPRG